MVCFIAQVCFWRLLGKHSDSLISILIFASKIASIAKFLTQRSIANLKNSVRPSPPRLLGLKQGDVAARRASRPNPCRALNAAGAVGARKLLAVLAVLEAELDIVAQGQAGNLDELRRERAQSTSGPTVDAPGTSSEGRR